MSATSMLEIKTAREEPVPAVVAGEPPAQPAQPVQPVGAAPNIVAQLVKFIPTETITLYVAYLALLLPVVAPEGGTVADADYSTRWAGVVVFAGVASLIVLGLAYGGYTRNRTADPAAKLSWPVFEMIVSPIAFLGWALALPDTPLEGIDGYRIEMGAFILLVTTFGVAFVAWMLDKTVNFEKILD